MSEVNRWESMPKDFSLDHHSKELVIIQQRRTRLGCMHWFLIVWLSIWTAGCIFLIAARGIKTEGGQPPPAWFILVFWLTDILVATLATYLIFVRRTFEVTPESLSVHTQVFSWKRSFTVSRSEIRQLRQVKTGGDGEDSFPTWGLVVEGARKRSLLFREPYELPLWLGETLAETLNVPFLPTEPPTRK